MDDICTSSPEPVRSRAPRSARDSAARNCSAQSTLHRQANVKPSSPGLIVIQSGALGHFGPGSGATGASAEELARLSVASRPAAGSAFTNPPSGGCIRAITQGAPLVAVPGGRRSWVRSVDQVDGHSQAILRDRPFGSQDIPAYTAERFGFGRRASASRKSSRNDATAPSSDV